MSRRPTATRPEKSLTVRSIGESTITALRIRALKEGRTVSHVVSDALLAYLATPLP